MSVATVTNIRYAWVPNSDVHSDDFGILSYNSKLRNVYVSFLDFSFLCLHHFPFLDQLPTKYICKGSSHRKITEPAMRCLSLSYVCFFAAAVCRTRIKIHKESKLMITGQFNGCLWLVFVFIVCLSLLPPGSCLQNNKIHKESSWNNCTGAGSLVFVFVVCLCS